MSIDTQAKRRAALGFGTAPVGVSPNATEPVAWRYSALGAYFVAATVTVIGSPSDAYQVPSQAADAYSLVTQPADAYQG